MSNMEQREILYEGKVKQVFLTDNPEQVIIHYKDTATAYNNVKMATIVNKGVLNNSISAMIFSHLEKEGIKTHFIKSLNERDQLCRKVSIIPIEVIVRNYVAGTMAKRLGLKEGLKPSNVIYEICYNDDSLGDPLINEHHAVALGIVTYDELDYIYKTTAKLNELLIELFRRVGVTLIDFKIEFGRTADGEIILADEISPDTCRLWDSQTKKRLDKDRFRRDMGGIIEAYQEIYSRLKNAND